jgi:hypothetical protein
VKSRRCSAPFRWRKPKLLSLFLLGPDGGRPAFSLFRGFELQRCQNFLIMAAIGSTEARTVDASTRVACGCSVANCWNERTGLGAGGPSYFGLFSLRFCWFVPLRAHAGLITNVFPFTIDSYLRA